MSGNVKPCVCKTQIQGESKIQINSQMVRLIVRPIVRSDKLWSSHLVQCGGNPNRFETLSLESFNITVGVRALQEPECDIGN